jgi:hypothetical protein
MASLSRRHFLQFASSAAASIGLSQLDIIRHSQRYTNVLAQDTPRKLALLVGINEYPFGDTLSGCVNDVELQKHLLIHRFGFKPKDIKTLTDKQATRGNILQAFENHLINQAKPGNVVVFHFSGHGSQVTDSECIYKNRSGECVNSTFMTVDNNLSFVAREKGGEVNDITGRTLFLLMSALQTENVTVVLDSCHSGGGKRGNITFRTVGGGSHLKASQAEREYQQQWLQRLNLSPEEYKRRLQAGVAKGVVIASAGVNQMAADYRFPGLAAGAFTYVMAQYLWQQTGAEPLETALANIGRSTNQMSSAQNPEFESQNSNYRQKPLYFASKQAPPADAIITEAQGDSIKLWLGGVNPDGIAAFDSGAILTVVDAQGKPQGEVQLQSRQGLFAEAKSLGNTKPQALTPGALLQERVRVIPKEVNLRIGLDDSLGNDKSKANTAINAIKQVQVIPLQQGQEVAYILGRITPENRQLQPASGEALPAVGSIGLFTPALEIIPGSFGAPGETVDAAITRLTAKFKSLLAAHIVKRVLNRDSSQVAVTVTMVLPDRGNQLAGIDFPVRGVGKTQGNPPPATAPRNGKKLPLNTKVQFQVTNQEQQDLHVAILVIDSAGEMAVVFPNTWTTSDDATRLKAGETKKIPEVGTDKFELTVQPPLGTTEVLVIASSTSLTDSLQSLQAIASRRKQERGQAMGLTGDDSINAIDSLLKDSDRATARGLAARQVRGIDTTKFTALSITFEAIK